MRWPGVILCLALLGCSREQSFDDEATFQELITHTADMSEGIAAFGERRSPEFRGW